jgi:outer membrane protein OmpA-like peptidoglycan-associated protein
LSRQQQVTEPEGPKVPAYIVTFSDMTTLLLTFFVMLLSLANVQDPELFYRGRGSFIQSLRELGLGMLYNRKRGPDFGRVKIKYFIKTPDKSFPGRIIDAKEEEIRRIFKEVKRSVETLPSQIVAKKTNFSISKVHFSPGESTLNEAAKKFLNEFCLDLQVAGQDLGSEAIKLYVLGLARDEATERQQWILSAKRAKAVADFLHDTLPSASNWPVYSWGAGPGGDWLGQDSPVSEQSQILIAVLRAGD